MYQEKFQNILGENEEIVRIEKAKKATFILQSIVRILPIFLVILGIYGLINWYIRQILLACSLDYRPIGISCIEICSIIIILLYNMFTLKGNSNYFVCLTNKRIIIRYGIFTNNYMQYSIDNVTGNIQTTCTQSIWDKKDGKCASGLITTNIELLPVGHESIKIATTYSIEHVYEMAKEIEKVVKANAQLSEKIIKE